MNSDDGVRRRPAATLTLCHPGGRPSGPAAGPARSAGSVAGGRNVCSTWSTKVDGAMTTPSQRSLFGCGSSAGLRPLAPLLDRRRAGQRSVDRAGRGVGRRRRRAVRAAGGRGAVAAGATRHVRPHGGVPRLLAFYDVSEALPDAGLVRCARRLVDHYRDGFAGGRATTGLCLYRHGRDSVAWHGDTIGRGTSRDTIVAIVSARGAPPVPAPSEGWRTGHPPRTGRVATSSSWAAAASTRGSTPSRRRPDRPGPASASSTGPPVSGSGGSGRPQQVR